jgi:TetR/AcrR family transcriptional regulator, lmrAB and yxaGH operons repressor
MEPTKDRLIKAMRQGLATSGYHGVSLADVLIQANAPKGVLYHHFPGGKRELALAAVELEVRNLRQALSAESQSSAQLINKLSFWITSACLRLEKSSFTLSCPLAGAAQNQDSVDKALRAGVDGAFTQLQEVLIQALTQCAMPAPRAQNWAHLLIVTFEGGLMLSRTAQSVTPLRTSCDLVLNLLATELGAQETQ